MANGYQVLKVAGLLVAEVLEMGWARNA